MGLLDRLKRKGHDAPRQEAERVWPTKTLDELIAVLREGGMGAALAAGDLGKLGDPRAVPALADLLLGRGDFGKAQDQTVQRHTAVGDAYTGLLAAETARQAALSALEKIGGPEAERALEEYRRREGST
jgi:hypothetical protein